MKRSDCGTIAHGSNSKLLRDSRRMSRFCEEIRNVSMFKMRCAEQPFPWIAIRQPGLRDSNSMASDPVTRIDHHPATYTRSPVSAVANKIRYRTDITF